MISIDAIKVQGVILSVFNRYESQLQQAHFQNSFNAVFFK